MKQNARKDPGGGGGGAFVIACVDIKLFVVSLAFLTLLLGLWQLQPYGSFMAAARSSANAPPCFLLSTTVAAVNNEVASSDSIPIKGTAATSDVPANIATVPARPARPARVENQNKRVLRPAPAVDPNKRALRPYGSAAALFVQFGAYRGGPRTFAIVGLASKPTHVFGTPYFKCEWLPNPSAADPAPRPVRTKAYKMLPDWGYGRVYTTVVVNCTFPSNPNVDNAGGKLLVHAYYSIHSRRYERFVALEEAPGSYDESRFSPPFQYDYLYCGSSLYGNLSASRMREWMAYHAHFFGPRSHFVFHDASGFSPEVKAVLDPWVRAGRLTVQDVRAEAEYDSYYYNQFLVVNDCLHRYRHAANWTFFFDVDEYMYLPNGRTLDQVLGNLSGYTQLTIKQNPMSSKLCLKNPSKDSSRSLQLPTDHNFYAYQATIDHNWYSLQPVLLVTVLSRQACI
ncbi:galactan beta-1,4-galactosyltransferase GALS1 isoform X2 [Brachypodium distachyon]|uniref:galactan beta-1,4-galactosyltransferase GALS1 isoform X2 n=1 Tax=Brachypodium distachyon TaxID=15368 RepID=UPI000D0D157A|nr:galactan beta-1,4-galactosyltransferase GALS1 isoform X2 [Brachypodium distachyon]|eukprot:XP_024317947.1 galactan beta-1,4-galactosyltransferase GALS1 isoform X2 [Brachypodium distachyon]